MKIENYRRVGIEVELRTYNIKGRIENKKVLARTSSKIIDGDLDIPYLQLVSEGEGTGMSYFELVFGAVEYSDLYQVREIIKIARGITGCNYLTDWVDKFNQAIKERTSLRELSNYVLSLQEGSNSINIITTGFNTVSIQANILIPVDSFATREKVNGIFLGIGNNTFPSTSVFNSIDKCELTKAIKGAIFIAVYVCSIYSFHYKKFSDNIIKQNFPILFKVELTTLLKELIPVTIIDRLNAPKGLFEKISETLNTKSRIFQENMRLLAENIRQEHPCFQITPRLGGVLPIYRSGEKTCIIMELRKGESSLLNKISEFLIGSNTPPKHVNPQIIRPVFTHSRRTVGQPAPPARRIVGQPARPIVTRSVNIPELSVLWT